MADIIVATKAGVTVLPTDRTMSLSMSKAALVTSTSLLEPA